MSIYAAPCKDIDNSSCDHRDELRQIKAELNKLEREIALAEIEAERKQARVNELRKRGERLGFLIAYMEYHRR